MTASGSWRPLSAPRRAADAFTTTPFTRLARVHAFSVATDTLVTVSLAGTLFFSIPSGAARDKVALYLVLTMAPFAVVAPLVGPAIDRIKGGRRFMVVLAGALRSLVCIYMVGHVDDLYLFPLAFLILVLGKTYGIAKAALVPTVVDDDSQLVRANSRLSLISGVVGLVVGGPAALIVKFIGPEAALVCGAITSATAALLATRLSAAAVAAEPPDTAEEVELRGAGIVHAAEAMGLLRGIVGFLTFLLAFDLKGGGNDAPVPVGLSIGRAVRHAAGFPDVGTGHPATAPTWHFGAVLVAQHRGRAARCADRAATPACRVRRANPRVGAARDRGGRRGVARCKEACSDPRRWRSWSASARARGGWRSTPSSNATRPTRTTAVRSLASRPASNCCGSSAASYR